MKITFLDFEQPIADLESKIEALRFSQDDSAVDISDEIARLEKKSQQLTREIYGKLSAWQVSQVSRHPQRPYTLDYLRLLFTNFEELHGDRSFADDHAIVGGLARFDGEPVMVSDKITLAADALFDFDKAVLRPEGKAKLDELASKAGALKLEVILAVGHTDRIGKDAYNQKLSEKRAAAVKEYLVSKGIEANRVYTEGKGEKQPKTGDACKKMGAESGKNKKLVECLQPDRRVDIEIIGTK
jgi:outer membrane protein OmpA-like peptidoglycan-associated protein